MLTRQSGGTPFQPAEPLLIAEGESGGHGFQPCRDIYCLFAIPNRLQPVRNLLSSDESTLLQG
jgi:hypothetical protein